MERIVICGEAYVQPDCCSFGDYGGSGSIGLANIRSIIELAKETKWDGAVYETWMDTIAKANDKETRLYAMDDEIELREAISKRSPPLVLHAAGSHGSECVWLLEAWNKTAEIVDDIASYPSLDDDASSEIEMEWESEAWTSWLRSDLERAAWPQYHEPTGQDNAAKYEAMSDADKFEAYREAMDKCNEYPVPEYSGVHVDVDRIAAAYREIIEAKL